MSRFLCGTFHRGRRCGGPTDFDGISLAGVAGGEEDVDPMAKKGSKLTEADLQFRDHVVEQLAGVGDVTSRSMFGGLGIFESGDMFGIVSKARLFFKVDDATRPKFEAAGSEKHGPMPYFEVPAEVLENADKLQSWARDAVAVAHATAKKKK